MHRMNPLSLILKYNSKLRKRFTIAKTLKIKSMIKGMKEKKKKGSPFWITELRQWDYILKQSPSLVLFP